MIRRYLKTAVLVAGILAYILPHSASAQIGEDPYNVPVLIVPGILESHNANKILHDKSGGTWDFAPTVEKMFKPLITRLTNEGYQEGVDLFVVHYDWRQGNEVSAREYLKPAIDHAKEVTGSQQVDIIAHSMGGLVARAYIQSEDSENDVLTLIMLGTPNAGASGAYLLWEGGILPPGWSFAQRWWVNRIENGLVNTRSTSSERPLTYRTFFPSLKELLPIYPFVTRDGNTLSTHLLTEQNTFLQNLRATAQLLTENGAYPVTIVGESVSTLNTVTVSDNRTQDDITNLRWRDGRADPYPPATSDIEGDGTVLVSSASESALQNVELPDTTHAELPGKSQDTVVEYLRGETVADYIPSRLARAAVGVDIFSPVMPVITGPNGEILSSDTNTFPDATFDWQEDASERVKMLTIVDPVPGTYTVTLTGTAEGLVSVFTSHASVSRDISEKKFTLQAQQGSVATYAFTIGDNGESIIIGDLDEDEEENNPKKKSDCKKNGWKKYGFKNQGQCIKFVNTGKDSR